MGKKKKLSSTVKETSLDILRNNYIATKKPMAEPGIELRISCQVTISYLLIKNCIWPIGSSVTSLPSDQEVLDFDS